MFFLTTLVYFKPCIFFWTAWNSCIEIRNYKGGLHQASRLFVEKGLLVFVSGAFAP